MHEGIKGLREANVSRLQLQPCMELGAYIYIYIEDIISTAMVYACSLSCSLSLTHTLSLFLSLSLSLSPSCSHALLAHSHKRFTCFIYVILYIYIHIYNYTYIYICYVCLCVLMRIPYNSWLCRSVWILQIVDILAACSLEHSKRNYMSNIYNIINIYIYILCVCVLMRIPYNSWL